MPPPLIPTPAPDPPGLLVYALLYGGGLRVGRGLGVLGLGVLPVESRLEVGIVYLVSEWFRLGLGQCVREGVVRGEGAYCVLRGAESEL